MAHKNNQIYNEVVSTLKNMSAFGESKHLDKIQNGTQFTQNKIYSYSTFKTYKKVCCDFATFAKKEYKCKGINEAYSRVSDYLKSKMEKGCSPWTLKQYACALGKLYQVPSNSFLDLPQRNREDVTRSRGTASRDKHFSIKNNFVLIEFCKASGLRRRELENLRGEALFFKNGQAYLHIENGKGGKTRDVMVLDNNKYLLEKMRDTPPKERVWGKVHSGCDVHGYRRDYAQSLYSYLAREIHSIPKDERYYCRVDKKGIVYDKCAMKEVSRNLGHERICVIAYSYL